MSNDNLESELKIPVQDLEQVRGYLQRARAVVVQTMAREVNLLLDMDDGRLRKAGCVLRLRRHGERRVLTFKGPADFRGAIKQRLEHETEVSDLESTADILGELGFKITMTYEKDREEWRMDDVSVVLDRTPMGSFVEVEGPREKLHETADLLGLNINSAVRDSYANLWLAYRQRHPELDLPPDMVFSK